METASCDDSIASGAANICRSSQRRKPNRVCDKGAMEEGQEVDLATTPTLQRPLVARSFNIRKTVEENARLNTDSSNSSVDGGSPRAAAKFSITDDDEPERRDRLQTIVHCGVSQQVKGRNALTADSDSPPRAPAALQHWIRSASTASPNPASNSETDLLCVRPRPTTAPSIALPLSRLMSSSPPCQPSGQVPVIRRGSSGCVTNIVLSRTSASRSTLRMSSSASHLPLLQSISGSGAKGASPYTGHQFHPHYAAAMLNSQMSDTESVGSCDSIQDSSSISHLTTGPANRWYRPSPTSGAFHTTRGPFANVISESVSSTQNSSPTSSVCSVRTAFSSQLLNNHLQHAQYVGRGHPIGVVRSLSNNLFDEDLLSQVGSAGSGSSTPFAQDAHTAAKHLRTEKVVSKHSLKGRLSKFQRLLDKAFVLVNMGIEESIIEGCDVVAKVMVHGWFTPKIGHDLAYKLCDYLRQMTYLDTLLHFFLHTDTKHAVRLAAGRALEQCLSASNRAYVAASDDFSTLDRFVNTIKSLKDSDEEVRMAVSLLESLFKHSSRTNEHLIELSALDFILSACKTTTNSEILKHIALALSNLAIYSDSKCHQLIIAKNVPDWLFFLASSQDDVSRYYACLAACILVSNKEIETAVTKSGTLSLVETFLLAHKPADFAMSDYKNIQGRPRQWLEKLVPVLSAKRKESRAMASFHFAMEAGIKRDQERMELFHQIGAVEALKQVAALPEEVAPKFASMALEVIGAEVPHKLSPQVPLWSVEDVQYWVTHIGFEKYAYAFGEQRVDGDLLLLLGDAELEEDIDIKSKLLRRRFMRELEGLKMAADYSCVDETQLDRFLVSIDPHFSVYTYQLLELGVDRSTLPSLNDETLRYACGIENPIHRLKMMKSIEEFKHIDDMEVALLSKHIDIFISYRRSTGNQLASLIKVLLQLRGYKVFIDVDRLYAGKFDCSLLKNIKAAKHFILVLTPHALDRCMEDDECNDWLHKELLCALQFNKNIIPVFDPQFEWPDESRLPGDVRAVTRFNGVRWVHEYQEACVDKLEKFIEGELNIDRGFYPSLPRPGLNCLSYRSGSRTASAAGPTDVADLVLDALDIACRERIPSRDHLLNTSTTLSPVSSD